MKKVGLESEFEVCTSIEKKWNNKYQYKSN